MARMLDTRLIRLQCYEGLDAAQALYEWNYPKQLLHIKLQRALGPARRRAGARDLLRGVPAAPPAPPGHHASSQAARAPRSTRSTAPTRSSRPSCWRYFSDLQVTIPEIGTIKAVEPPYVILTSNRIRELSDALRRRCLYLWIDYPGFEKEVRIVDAQGPRRRTSGWPGRSRASWRACARCGWPSCPAWRRRSTGRRRWPSLHADHLDEELVLETLGCVLKDRRRHQALPQELARLRDEPLRGRRGLDARGARRSWRGIS